MFIRSKNLIFMLVLVFMTASGQLSAMHTDPEVSRGNVGMVVFWSIAYGLMYTALKVVPPVLTSVLRSDSKGLESCLPPNQLSNDSKDKLETGQKLLIASAPLSAAAIGFGIGSIALSDKRYGSYYQFLATTSLAASLGLAGAITGLVGALSIQQAYDQVSGNWGNCTSPGSNINLSDNKSRFDITRGLAFAGAAGDFVSEIAFFVWLMCS